METDILIIGGGVAGMVAASEAAASNLKVTLVEQTGHLGGHFRHQIQLLKNPPEDLQGLRGFEIVDYFIKELETYPNVKILLNHTLIGRYENGSFGVSDGESVYPISYSKAIFTTGAAEKPLPFPKWTLPGIMTIGAAQILMNREMVKPGNKALVVGTNEVALETALQLTNIGVKVQAIVEQSDSIEYHNDRRLEEITANNIPIILNTKIDTAVGRDMVEKVVLRNSDTMKEIEVDLVCTSAGYMPAIEPFKLIDCNLSYDELLGGWIPAYDEDFMLSEKDIYAAGNAAGITQESGIILTSALAGLAAVQSTNSNREITDRKLKIRDQLDKFEKVNCPEVWEARRNHISEKLYT